MTFASSADPLPTGWYRLPQDTYKARSKAAATDPLVVTFTASGWPRGGGVPLGMAAHVENGDDLPLRGIREPLTIFFRFFGQGYADGSFAQTQRHDASSRTRRDLFIDASTALTLWLDRAKTLTCNASDSSNLRKIMDSEATFSIASIYFPSTANIAQVEVIVIPSRRN